MIKNPLLVVLTQMLDYFIIGIGTNLGNKFCNLINSLKIISHQLRIHKVSNIYKSPALFLPSMPLKWQMDFLNIAILVSFDKHPRILLDTLKQIEHRMGRIINAPRFSPRIIDLDILIGTKNYNDTALQIPHKSFYTRNFAYLPAGEIFKKLTKNKVQLIDICRIEDFALVKQDKLDLNSSIQKLLLKKKFIDLY